MRLLTVSVALGFILALEIPARAQTAETQDQVKDAVAKEKATQVRKAAQDAWTKEKEKTQANEKAATLEELLAQALKDNPDIRVAESKLREAEAELNRVRLLVTQKVVAQQRDIALQKAALDNAETTYRRAQQLHSSGALSQEEYRNAQLTLEKLKAELARVEAELPYLLGASAIRRIVTSRGEWFLTKPMESRPLETATSTQQKALEERADAKWLDEILLKETRSSQSPLPAGMTDKIRKALDTPVHVDFKQAKPKEILDFLQQHTKGFNLVEQVRMDKAAPVDLHLTEPVPVGAVFQFLEDQYGWRFVVREYGIVIAEPGRVPPGAVHLQNFWKNRPAQATTTSSAGTSSTSSSTSGQQK
jgi:hypothetical protein